MASSCSGALHYVDASSCSGALHYVATSSCSGALHYVAASSCSGALCSAAVHHNCRKESHPQNISTTVAGLATVNGRSKVRYRHSMFYHLSDFTFTITIASIDALLFQ